MTPRIHPLPRLGAFVLGALLSVSVSVVPAHAAPFIWDQDNDRTDDRIELVDQLGFAQAFDQADTLLRQRIAVTRVAGGLVYEVYVIFDHPTTSGDVLALTLLGMPVLHRFEAVPAVHSVATFLQVQAAAALSGVKRIEAVPVHFPLDRVGAAAIGARDPTGGIFPTWAGAGGGDGSGVVVAFLDTGINDAPDGDYPGHESLIGRCLGGASFVGGSSDLDTPLDGSVNPVDRGGSATRAHGTHVAGIAVGSGGASGYAMGVAPGARFVDVKVLNDLGFGTEVPEALDWCIHNRARDWGDADPALTGIDVINLSLSSVDQSDGQDMAAVLASRATELGIVVVASVGNDGLTAHIPSPAGGPGVIAVGSLDDGGTPGNGDDVVAPSSNRGPRADDGDHDPTDEEKPDLVAPGVAVLSADGDLSSDGAQYQRLSGTSMAAPFVSGAAALLRARYPSLTPAQILTLLRATATRPVWIGPFEPTAPDPGWAADCGFGTLDLYGAHLEQDQPQHSQLERLKLEASDTQVTATLRTQRELGAAWFVFERAPELGAAPGGFTRFAFKCAPDAVGAPGAFTPYDSVAAAGSAELNGPADRHVYVRTWTVPASEAGVAFWYRAAYTEDGVRYSGPARRLVSPPGTSLATIDVTLVHNAYDTDVDAVVTPGSGAAASSGAGANSGPIGFNPPEATPTPSFHLPPSSSAVSSDWLPGSAAAGNIEWRFRIEVSDPAASSWLPPDETHLWMLSVAEGGDPAQHGRVTSYRLTCHTSYGDVVYDGGPAPQETVEGGTVYASLPQATLAVGPPPSAGRALRFGPNPVPTGGTVSFSSATPQAGPIAVFDLSGRRVGSAGFAAGAGGFEARWSARSGAGEPLAPGVYFARLARGPTLRIAVVGR